MRDDVVEVMDVMEAKKSDGEVSKLEIRGGRKIAP